VKSISVQMEDRIVLLPKQPGGKSQLAAESEATLVCLSGTSYRPMKVRRSRDL